MGGWHSSYHPAIFTIGCVMFTGKQLILRVLHKQCISSLLNHCISYTGYLIINTGSRKSHTFRAFISALASASIVT